MDCSPGLRLGASIHDLGKISVPQSVLGKPGKLSREEFAVMARHSQVGYDVASRFEWPWPVPDMILQHHERYDGSGYPQGLFGSQIILEARVIGVADTYEALVRSRSYATPASGEEALEHVLANAGILYDPETTEALERLVRSETLELN